MAGLCKGGNEPPGSLKANLVVISKFNKTQSERLLHTLYISIRECGRFAEELSERVRCRKRARAQ